MGAWLEPSGIFTSPLLGVNWSRCSEKLPEQCKRFAEEDIKEVATKVAIG